MKNFINKFKWAVLGGLVVLSGTIYAGTYLFVPEGGTGAQTLTGCLSGNGTSAITGSGVACISNNFSPNSVITSNGSGTLIATTSQLTIGSLISTTTNPSFFQGRLLLATTSSNNIDASGVAPALEIGQVGGADSFIRFSTPGAYKWTMGQSIGNGIESGAFFIATSSPDLGHIPPFYISPGGTTTIQSLYVYGQNSLHLTGLTTGQLVYTGDPDGKVYNVATTSVTCSGSTTCSSFTIIGSSPITISSTGGSGSSGGSWSTTTSQVSGQYINYPNNTTDIACIGSTATSTCKYWFDPNTNKAMIGNSTTASTTIMGNATTTGSFYAGTATSTNTFGSSLATCNSTASGLTWSAGLFGCNSALVPNTRTITAGTGLSGGGDLSSDRTITLNTGNTNTWSVLQNFNYASITSYLSSVVASTTNLIVNGESFNDLTGSGLSISSSALTCNTASASVFGCISAASFSKHDSATTTFSTGLTYTTGTNAVTVNTSQNIATLSNLTTNGFVRTSGSNGTLGVSADPCTVAMGCTNSAAFAANSILASNSAGTGLIATTSQLTVGSLLATSTDISNFFGSLNIGTTSVSLFSKSIARSLIASTSQPQLALEGGVTDNHWNLRSIGGWFYLATSSPTSTATSTNANFAISNTGTTTITGLNITQAVATSTSNVGFNITSGCYAINNTCTGGGSGSGTVTSVGLSLPTAFTITNSPVTTSGTLTATVNFGANSILTADSAGTNIIATTSQLTFGSFISTSSATNIIRNPFTGFATNTPNGQVQIATTSANQGFRPQLILTDSNASTNAKHWYMTSNFGNFEIGTTSDTGTYATSSAITLAGANTTVGHGQFAFATSSPLTWLTANAPLFTIESGTETSTFTIQHNGSTTPSFTVLGTNGNGNVGIGTTTPSQALSVSGNSIFSGTIIVTGLTAFATGDSAVCVRTNFIITFDAGVSSCIVSSKYTKDFIAKREYAEAKRKIDRLNVIIFKYKDSGKEDIGLYAEEVAEIDSRYAQYVTKEEILDGHLFKVGDPKAINWSAIQADMIVVMQHQNNPSGNSKFYLLIGLFIVGFLYQQRRISKLK